MARYRSKSTGQWSDGAGVDLDTIARAWNFPRQCGVCFGLSPTWDGHDRDCRGRVWESVPLLIAEIRRLREENETEAMRWCSEGCPSRATCADSAEKIVAWVNDNGGEARYEPQSPIEPRIAVRTVDGWKFGMPGWYFVMGSATFQVRTDHGLATDGPLNILRDFYPCDPETFEQRWERAE